MQNSYINLDLYQLIAEHLDWATLQNFKYINYFCHNVYKKEINSPKRLNSPYPFGEKNSKIQIIIDDIYLHKIYCVIENIKIEIPLEKIFMNYVFQVLNDWFYYSFNNYRWNLTGNIIKSIIRINNKILETEKRPMNEDIQCLTFAFKDGKSFLFSVK